jgi:peptidoglycan/LPS O-acetylase OafA/YrhL
VTGSGLVARHRHPPLGWATVALSLATFVLVLVGMWPELDDDVYWRVTGVIAIGALEGAHASFVLSRRRLDDPAATVAATRVAVAAATVSAAMGAYPLIVMPDDIAGERYAQVLGAVLVVQLVATAVAPVLRRLGRDRELAARDEPSAAFTPAERLADEILAAADRIERLAPQPQVADECARLRRLARAARAGSAA